MKNFALLACLALATSPFPAAAKGDSSEAAPDDSSAPAFTAEENASAVRDWVTNFIDLETKNDVDAIAGSYWETVDYLGDGDVDPNFIRKDKAASIRKWPTRKITVTGDIVVKGRGDDTYWDVTYPSHIVLQAKNGATMSMDAKNTLVVTLAGETYAISSQHATFSNQTTGDAATKRPTAIAADYPGAPASVVAAYIEADGAGLALDSDTCPQVLRYTVWPDAPGWDTFAVIKSYDIGEVGRTGKKASVEIIYNVLGSLSATAFIRKPARERVSFELEKTQGRWKIVNPQLPPHLFVPAAITALESTGADKAALEKLRALE